MEAQTVNRRMQREDRATPLPYMHLLFLFYPHVGPRGLLEPSCPGARDGSTGRTGSQPTASLDWSVHLTSLSLDWGRKPEESHACTGKACTLHTERPGFEPGTFLLWGHSVHDCTSALIIRMIIITAFIIIIIYCPC